MAISGHSTFDAPSVLLVNLAQPKSTGPVYESSLCRIVMYRRDELRQKQTMGEAFFQRFSNTQKQKRGEAICK